MPELRTPPPPYVPPCFPGELLSSWLRRVAAEYGVELAHLASHVGLPVSRASVIDNGLSRSDLRLAASAMRLEPGELQAMVHVPNALGLGPSASVLQQCSNCRAGHKAAARSLVAIRAWFEYWQIECGSCGRPFSPAGTPRLDRVNPACEEPLWFESPRSAARIGARKLADFARRPFATGWSPVIILRLLSMRFDAVAFADGRLRGDVAQRRLAELFVPGLAERWHENLVPEPWTNARPVRLVTARTILLAGMATALDDRLATLGVFKGAASHVPHRDFGPRVSGLGIHADPTRSHQ
jgi:TniQ